MNTANEGRLRHMTQRDVISWPSCSSIHCDVRLLIGIMTSTLHVTVLVSRIGVVIRAYINTQTMSTTTATTTLTSVGLRILTKYRIGCRAVVEDWIILFAAYTAAETLDALQWAGQQTKVTLFVEGSRTESNTWAHNSQPPPKQHLDQFSRFSQDRAVVTNTHTHTHMHTHTDHATCDISSSR